jgi:hypothetical protein
MNTKTMALAALALLALAAGAAAQTEADCDRSVKNCRQCRYQFFRGTTTKAICTKCDTGYLPKASGRACYCAAGYYTDNSTSVAGSVGFTCKACGPGHYCPGSKITAASSTARFPCGANKLTTTVYAQSELECMVLPGYGWAAGDASAICEAGSYNPGYNARKCSPCPGGLTTPGQGSNSSQECMAGIGFYYLRGKAVACARGTYKGFIANQDCDKCPTGISTPNDTVSADVKTKCQTLLPGYELQASPVLGDTNATECPPNTYRADEVVFTSGSGQAAIPCTPCPNGLVTLPNVTRATSLDACVTPPGWGWSAATAASAVPNSPAGQATICPVGQYNPGYNRQPCASCGTNLLTDAAGATNADACYTPAGWGNIKDAVLATYSATICPVGTYGRPNNTYGLVDVECTKCLDHSSTSAPGATNQSQCLVEAGYGWADGQVLECEYGYYNPGGNQNLCTYCGDGYNTSASANATAGEYKATDASQCRVDFGYFNGSSLGIEACLRGYYKDTLGPHACSQCPAGVSTTKAQAGLKISDCNTCKPGFGVAGGVIADLSAPTCARCTSGTYSSGFKAGGQICDVCPQAANFTGKMVSRAGIFTPEDCYGEYTTDKDVFDNQQAWDLIPLDGLVHKTAATSIIACQELCSTTATCQYFAFYAEGGNMDYPSTGAADAGKNQCYFKEGDVTPVAVTTSTTDSLVAFEIREGQYVVYKSSSAEQVGVTLTTTGQSLFAAKAECEANRECVGIAANTIVVPANGPTPAVVATGWTLFGAVKREGAIGKIRVIGENIQTWVPLPTGL